jgi:DNA invertase Pin-like site-specific DNA recombinase
MGVFAEFERAMIQARVKAGMERAKLKGTKSGRAIGRPRIKENVRVAIRNAYMAGNVGMRGLAKRFDVSLGTVQSALSGP